MASGAQPKLSPGMATRLHVRVLRMEVVLALMTLALCGLIAFQFWKEARPTPVCYVTSDVTPGLLLPGEVPRRLLAVLGEHVVLALTNVTEHTAEAAHEKIRAFVHPAHVVDYDTRRRRERDLIRQYSVSTNFAVSSTEVGKVGELHAVRVNGLRDVYAASVRLRSETLSAVLHFQESHPTPGSPFGLTLVQLRFSQPLAFGGSQ